MITLREAAKQALEVMKSADVDPHSSDAVYKAIADLRAALAQEQAEPAQEPVGWLYPDGLAALKAGKCWTAYGTKQGDNNVPIYSRPYWATTVIRRSSSNGRASRKRECAGFESPPASPEPVQEPVAWMCPDDPDRATAFAWKAGHCENCGKQRVPLYTAPPQRKPLSDADLAKIWDDALDQLDPRDQLRFIARAVERLHGIGGQP